MIAGHSHLAHKVALLIIAPKTHCDRIHEVKAIPTTINGITLSTDHVLSSVTSHAMPAAPKPCPQEAMVSMASHGSKDRR